MSAPRTGRTCRRCRRKQPYNAFPRPRGKAQRARLSTICRECHAAREFERERWQKEGRECPRCEQIRKCPEEISLAQAPVCLHCQRKRHADKERARRTKPEVRQYYRDLNRRHREANPEAYYEAQRRYREKVLSDPRKAKEWRENNRIYHRLWRQRRGIQSRVSTPEEYRRIAGIEFGGHIPATALAALIDRMIERETLDIPGSYGAQEIVCERLGLSTRTLFDWRSGKRRSVQFDIADRVLTRAGLFWWDVWEPGDEGYETVAALFEGEAMAA